MSTHHWKFPGSRWWKFDFHTHTPASSDYGRDPDPAVQTSLRQRTHREWLTDFIAAGIECVAITDHNCGDWIDPLKAELAKMRVEGVPGADRLHLFPGAELTISGAHYLAIFDALATTRTITDLLAVAGYNNAPKNAEGYCAESISRICQEVLSRGGLFIPAHVDLTGTGMFKLHTNLSAIDPILKLDGVVAMEVSAPGYTPPGCYTAAKLKWTSVLGSDSHHPKAPASPPAGLRLSYPGSHWTWVKMGTNGDGAPDITSLRLALLDGPGVSVNRSDDTGLPADLNVEPDEAIESIEIANTRVMGNGVPQYVSLNPWLNSLVGGRGSGKSTVVHFLRLALRREGELANIGADAEVFKSFDRFRSKAPNGVVNDQSKVQLIYRHQGTRYRLNWPNKPGVADVEEWMEASGTPSWQPAGSQEITARFPVRIFSQGQVAALAGERSRPLMEIIDQAVDSREWKNRWDEQERNFVALRARARELEARLQNRDRTVGALEDVRRKLLRFEAAEHAKVLREYQLRRRQSREVERQLAEARGLASRIELLGKELLPADVGEGIFEATDAIGLEASARIKVVQAAINQAADDLRAAGEKLQKAVDAEEIGLRTTAWQAEVATTKTAYDKLVAELQAQGVQDPSEYGRLVQERQRLEGDVKALDSLKETLDAIRAQTAAKQTDLVTLRQEISRKRADFLATTLANDAYVQIQLDACGREPEAIAVSLRAALGIDEDLGSFVDDIYRKDPDTEAVGLVAQILKNLPTDKVAAETELYRRIADIKSELAKVCHGGAFPKIGARLQSRLKRSAEGHPEFTDRILTWFPDDTLSVSYSPRGNGQDFVPILQGSAGQKAAAMLAFFLKYGDEPIILDQPEDDLDNHLIYSLVVRQIRERKLDRQIVTVTHNPNIVVNGDAELVHAFDFRAGQCKVIVSGGLQDEKVREEVCKVMEGGREAFEKRYQRIGKGGSHV
jgi:energy-coupling factor transporter ATP-binding protein EcfA2